VPAGLAIHKDGRIFLACVGDLKTGGGVIALQRDGLQPVRQLLEVTGKNRGLKRATT